MNAWGEDYHKLDVYSYGRTNMLADYVDGLGPFRKPWDVPYEITRNVNPDRHARIRQKHFHYAYATMVARAYEEQDVSGDAGNVFQVGDMWWVAFDACDWGTQ